MMARHQINQWNVSHRFDGKPLLYCIGGLAAFSIFFFGYDQGLMGGVNNAKHYIDTMGIGYVDATDTPQITNSVLQGGIVAVYYLGTLLGALAGGYLGDKIGRIHSIGIGAAWAVFGACLQCSAQNHQWMICARLINGCGTGILNAIVPVYATEVSEHTSRGMFVATEFTLNVFGVVVAYWLEFGLSFGALRDSQFRWRFPIAFQIFPLMILLGVCWFFPESPRWLVKVGRHDEAEFVLGKLRGETGEGAVVAASELKEIQAAFTVESEAQTSYVAMVTGMGTGDLHIGRRVQLCIWLQIVQEWTGIAGVTVYAPTIFRLAGFGAEKSQWISGLNDVFYMLATLICVFTLDRIGRRYTLYWGAIVMGITMFLAGGFSRLASDSVEGSKPAQTYGAAAAAMIFIFTSAFGATWLTVPWLYPAEIFPLTVRAKGNALGVVGWSIGNGWLTLLCPIMFDALKEKTFYIFAACNLASIPMVWALYPETANRTLEEIDFLFAAKTPWNWDAESTFSRLKGEHPDIVRLSGAKQEANDVETGSTNTKKESKEESEDLWHAVRSSIEVGLPNRT